MRECLQEIKSNQIITGGELAEREAQNSRYRSSYQILSSRGELTIRIRALQACSKSFKEEPKYVVSIDQQKPANPILSPEQKQ
jgi:hypothetical protein